MSVVIKNIELDEKVDIKLIRSTMLGVIKSEIQFEQGRDNFKRPIYQSDGKKKYTTPEQAVINNKGRIDIFDAATDLTEGTWFIIQRLLKTSPVDTGEYLNSHYIDIKNQSYKLSGLSSKKELETLLQDVREIRIYNISIYANKLERVANAKTKTTKVKNISYLFTNGVYDYFSKKANLAKIKNVYTRVGRSDNLPVLGDRGYKTKDGKRIVIPVMQIKLIGDE